MILKPHLRSIFICAKIRVRRFLRRISNIIGNTSDSFEMANATSTAIFILGAKNSLLTRQSTRSKSVTAAIISGELSTR